MASSRLVRAAATRPSGSRGKVGSCERTTQRNPKAIINVEKRITCRRDIRANLLRVGGFARDTFPLRPFVANGTGLNRNDEISPLWSHGFANAGLFLWGNALSTELGGSTAGEDRRSGAAKRGSDDPASTRIGN